MESTKEKMYIGLLGIKELIAQKDVKILMLFDKGDDEEARVVIVEKIDLEEIADKYRMAIDEVKDMLGPIIRKPNSTN